MQRVKIEYPTSILYHRYPQQIAPQPCFVELDPRSCSLRADWDPIVGNAVPIEVAHGFILRHYVERPLTVKGWRILLNKIAPLAWRVCRGWSREWDGSRYVGVLTRDAEQANDTIRDIVREIASEYAASTVEPEDWYVDGPPPITPETSDAELERIIRAELRHAASQGIVVPGLEDYLRELRNAR